MRTLETYLKAATVAVQSLVKAGYSDTRTSSTVFTNHLDAAAESLLQAAHWLKALSIEEAKSEQPEKPATLECEACGELSDRRSPCASCGDMCCPDCLDEDDLCGDCPPEDDED